MKQRKIIIAPLNWGLGHASRCIPIINLLISNNYTPVIACDGVSLEFLKKEFPLLEYYTLPSYHIKYKRFLRLGLILQLPVIFSSIKKEQIAIEKIIEQDKDIVGIISDNRLGCFNKKITSVYITHQLKLPVGIVSPIANLVHHFYIKKYNKCWIPDEEKSNYSGKLSQSKLKNTLYTGVLTRLTPKKRKIKYDILVLLSGIENRRKKLEDKLIAEFKNYPGKILFVRGVMHQTELTNTHNITFKNYLTTSNLETAISESELVICRSGYSTLMDLSKFNKKAFLIPTKGQTEQEYLAKEYKTRKWCNSTTLENFNLSLLQTHSNYTGIKKSNTKLNQELLEIFK